MAALLMVDAASQAAPTVMFSGSTVVGSTHLANGASGVADNSAKDDPRRLTAIELFDLAAHAVEIGDLKFAEQALRALTTNKDIDIRCEARFRLAKLLSSRLQRLRDAATLLRQILDERPRAAGVRIELARLNAELGDNAAAQAQLRAAEAVGLPAAVQRDVRFFMQALDARRRLGASLEASLMPDSNANRATSAATIGTQLGDLTLSPDARRHSGIGGNLRGQGYAKVALTEHMRLQAQVSGAVTVFRDSAFDDFTLAPRAGPEFDLGKDRLTVLAGPTWRWYGSRPYTTTIAVTSTWQHALGARAQMRVDGTLGGITNLFDAAEGGGIYSLAVGLDRALSARSGVGLQLSAFRQNAHAAAYALIGGNVSAYAFREMGPMTASVSAAYGHVEADGQLLLFPRRRIDNAASTVLSLSFRQVRLANISPIVRVRYEKNASSLDIYRYDRLSAEVGFGASF